MTIDISSLDYRDLSDLRSRIDERMTEMRETGVPELRTRLAEQAAALGLTIEDVVGNGQKKRGRKPKPREGHND